jgi:hypothetical protein
VSGQVHPCILVFDSRDVVEVSPGPAQHIDTSTGTPAGHRHHSHSDSLLLTVAWQLVAIDGKGDVC